MRADRLLALMLLLQTRGKLTANALAAELSVSRRTILRDVDALSLAGVPIYTEGGHGGGIALDERYRTRLTGLHTPEVQALFVASNQVALRDVGLQDAAEHMALKLLAALPTTHSLAANHIRQRLMLDSTWWWYNDEKPLFWDDLQQAVYEDYLIETLYESYQGDVVERILEPYSLVYKSSYWYLVARRDDEFRTYRVSRFHQLRLLDQHFTRRADFDLQRYWERHLKEFVESFSEYSCSLSIHPDHVSFVRWLLPGRWEVVEEVNQSGWVTLELMIGSPQLAKMLVFGLSTFVEVLAPEDLAEAVIADAHQIIQHFSSPRHRE